MVCLKITGMSLSLNSQHMSRLKFGVIYRLNITVYNKQGEVELLHYQKNSKLFKTHTSIPHQCCKQNIRQTKRFSFSNIAQLRALGTLPKCGMSFLVCALNYIAYSNSCVVFQ